MKITLFQRKSCICPTITGWITIAIVCLAGLISGIVFIHPYLAITKQVYDDTLIVEGWLPDYSLKSVDSLYKTGTVKRIFVTGGPLFEGFYLSQYKTFAALGAATLRTFNIPDSIITEIPAPLVKKDRTLTSAIALKTWLDSSNQKLPTATLVTQGVHARRSFFVFRKTLPQTTMGVIATESLDYDSNQWYKSSEGFKTVITEIISLIYSLVSYN